jgi:hypothetical protein
MTTLSPNKLDDLTPHQLIDEVKQIAEQYSREVTTSRRTWPRSVRERVLALARLGVPRARIGKECGIPIATVSLWCKQIPGRKRSVRAAPKPLETSGGGRFLALAGSDTCHSNPTVGIGMEVDAPETLPAAATGLHILLPGGIEVRGLTSLDQVLALYRGCRS